MRRCNNPRFPTCDAPVKVDPAGLILCLNGHSQPRNESDLKETVGEAKVTANKRFSSIAAEMELDELGLFCNLAREHQHCDEAAKTLHKHEMALRSAVRRLTGLGWGDFRKRVLDGRIGSLAGAGKALQKRKRASIAGAETHAVNGLDGFIRYQPVKPHLGNQMMVGWTRHRGILGADLAARMGEKVNLLFKPKTREVVIVPDGEDIKVIHREGQKAKAISLQGFNNQFGIDWRGHLQAEWDEKKGGFVVVLPEEAMKEGRDAE